MKINKIKNDNSILSTLNYTNYINYKSIDYVFLSNSYRVFTEIKKILTIKKVKIIMPYYELLKNNFKKFNNKFFFFNIRKKNKFDLFKDGCCLSL